MTEKIRELIKKNREIIVYLIVGVMTTVVAWAVRFLWNIVFYAGTPHPNPVQTTILTIVEFVAGVAFAYPTNRKWVFRSTNPNILKEAAGFVSARLTTLGIQIGGGLMAMLMQVIELVPEESQAPVRNIIGI